MSCSRHFRWSGFLFCLAVLVPASSFAQAGAAAGGSATATLPPIQVPAEFRGRPVRVVTRVIEPFVVSGNNGALRGFSIDLWNAIATKLSLQTEYTTAPTVADLLATMQTGKADAGISAVSITAERDVVVDFSQPMYESGLQIAIRERALGRPSELAAIWDVLTSSTMLHLFALMLVSAVVIAHIVWFVERQHEECGVVEHKRYFPGIFKAFWWSMGTIGSQVDEMPRTWLGRAIALFWMFCAIVFVAYFTAAATSNLTVRNLRGVIQGPDDLPGKRVATTTGSTAAAYLAQHKATVVQTASLDDAWAMLADGRVEAVVSDAPVVEYYAANAGRGKVEIVGDVFQKEYYGIVFPDSSPLRGPVNEALLRLEEDGTYQQLQDKWFKSASADAGGN